MLSIRQNILKHILGARSDENMGTVGYDPSIIDDADGLFPHK